MSRYSGEVETSRFIRAFVDDATAHGGALVMSGDAGVGKTVLLDVAAASAFNRSSQ